MSGRSAIVRAKTAQSADKTAKKHAADFGPDYEFIYGLSTPPVPFQALPINTQSYGSIPYGSVPYGHVPYGSVPYAPQPRRRQSISSGSSSYGYVAPISRKVRPIVLASAIEKSDFRVHFDGMSRSVRGKLSKLMKKDDDLDEPPRQMPVTTSTSSESGSRSTDFAPSFTASPSSPPLHGINGFQSYACLNQDSRRNQEHSRVPRVKRFEGGGKAPQVQWKLLSNNPQLWNEEGDVFVYIYPDGSTQKPPASFRIKSSVLYDSGCSEFIHQLHDESVPPGWPDFISSNSVSPIEDRSPRDTVSSADFQQNGFSQSLTDSGVEDMDTIRPLEISKNTIERAPEGIRYEIYVPWLEDSGVAMLSWHITTRNFFAVLYDNNALVGSSLWHALSGLWERLNKHPTYLDRDTDRMLWITDYLIRHKFDDVRNNLSHAATLLAFSELPGVHWREGYIEGFIHCAGLMKMGLDRIEEYKEISPRTRFILQNAHLEQENRLERAQNWLSSFDFTEMWLLNSASHSSVRSCFDRLRKWLCKYYEGVFLHWPPVADGQTWLSRDIVVRLRNDFQGLYDYLVDRDATFSGLEYRNGSKWSIQTRGGQPLRNVDTSELAFTEILVGFDDRNGFPHIPHPYPITPPSVPAQSKQKTSFLMKKAPTHSDSPTINRNKMLSYGKASNCYILKEYINSELTDNFIKFEQTDMIDHLDPFEARRARWLLIYGVLQVLATVAVDSPLLKYGEGVRYHVNPEMKGVVPWAPSGSHSEEEATHTKSYCWTVPRTWEETREKARQGAHKPIMWGEFGDGRIRVEQTEKVTITSALDSSYVGRSRAAEWVATTRAQNPESGSENGGSGSGSVEITAGNASGGRDSGTSSGDNPDSTNGDNSIEAAVLTARRRRAQYHGFTDFQPPREW